MQRSRYIECLSVSLLALSLGAACTPVYKAHVDMTGSGGIVWPGQPEKPRIKYLWSLRDLAPSPEGSKGVLDAVSGKSEESDTPDFNTLIRPQGVYVDDKKIYIADPGAMRVSVVDRVTMDVLQITEARGESLQYPRGVVADPAGNIYVSDSEMKKVISYSPDGKFRFFFKGDFARPEGLAVDAVRGLIYVVDTDGHVVYVYGADGEARGKIGGKGSGVGEFYYPTYAATDKEGNLYVTDFLNFRVQIFSPAGAPVKIIGSLGDSYDTLDKPKGVAVDTEGHVYIVDGARNMVKIFDREGRLLLFFGQKGERYGDFYLPAGIFIDSKDIIYVADSINMRIQAFQFLGGNQR